MPVILGQLLQYWRKLVISCNDLGVPLPLIRDPKSKRGDVALTLVFLSSLYVQISLIGKITNKLEGIDTSSALNWFYSCCALYWARKVSVGKGGKVTLEEASQPAQQADQPEPRERQK